MPETVNWVIAWPYFLTAFLGGYSIGSVPFGLILTSLAGYGDIRRIGSGNIGATNVLRTGNKALAALTLLLDGGKGAAAVLIAYRYGQDVAMTAAAGAMLGHLFPVWLRFSGGKGVATALGILLALSFPVGAAACITWLLVAFAFRYSSLSALVAVAVAPVFAYGLADVQRAELALFIAALVWLRHWANIKRLLNGEEPKIGHKNEPR